MNICCGKCFRSLRAVLMLTLLVAAGAYLWYWTLDDRHQRYIRNIVRQIPDLPARFFV
jgi:hypothetical protein